MQGTGFEIVKNCGGSFVPHNLPTEKETDAKLLLKSIAPAGYLYLRLLLLLVKVKELAFDDPTDVILEVSPFCDTLENKFEDVL